MEQALGEAGYDLTDPVAREGEEREVVAESGPRRSPTRSTEATTSTGSTSRQR